MYLCNLGHFEIVRSKSLQTVFWQMALIKEIRRLVPNRYVFWHFCAFVPCSSSPFSRMQLFKMQGSCVVTLKSNSLSRWKTWNRTWWQRKKRGKKESRRKKTVKKEAATKENTTIVTNKIWSKGYQKSHHIRKDVFTPKNGAQICASNEDNLKTFITL